MITINQPKLPMCDSWSSGVCIAPSVFANAQYHQTRSRSETSFSRTFNIPSLLSRIHRAALLALRLHGCAIACALNKHSLSVKVSSREQFSERAHTSRACVAANSILAAAYSSKTPLTVHCTWRSTIDAP